MTAKRLKNYGKVNQDKILSFTWENKKYFGYKGDSLAASLLANNINIIGSIINIEQGIIPIEEKHNVKVIKRRTNI